MNKSIVFCRNIHWDDPIRVSTHTIASEFARRGWHCGWISRVMTPWRMFRSDFQHAREIWLKGGLQHAEVFEYSPLFLLAYGNAPVLNTKAVWKYAPSLTVPGTKSVLTKAGLTQPDVCWIGTLSMGSIGTRLGARKIVYHAHDAFSLYPDASPMIKKIEEEMISHASVVVATAESTRLLLQDLYPRYADRIHTVTHGVYLEMYQQVIEEPDDLTKIPHPRAIVMGTLGMQDGDLLIHAARSLPEVHIVLIGPGGTQIMEKAHLANLTNIHLLGPKPQSDLPEYLINCDVGLIAYSFEARDSRLFGTNPMKRYEYAAAGLPTISTDLREYSLTPSPIYTAHDPNEFVDQIRKALSERTAHRAQLLQFAEDNTWTKKYQQIVELIESSEDARHAI